MSEYKDHYIWKNPEYVRKYIENFRGGIPYAVDHIEFMLKAINEKLAKVKNFADLGCGNGILAGAVLLKNPDAYGTLIDFYGPVLDEAKQQLIDHVSNLTFIEADLMKSNWLKAVRKNIPFDLVASGFTIHDFPDKRKKEIFEEVYKSLKPGGLFMQVEVVMPESDWIKNISDKQMVDTLMQFNKKKGVEKTAKQIKEEYIDGIGNKGNVLATLSDHTKWLKKAGFEDVTVFFKAYIGAVFGGIKPKKD